MAVEDGARPITISDVARRAGVSTATVSRVISGATRVRPATREEVLAAVRELGYRPSGILGGTGTDIVVGARFEIEAPAAAVS